MMQTSQAANAPYGEPNFLGLPRKVREMVYRELFGKREEQGFQGPFPNILTDRVLAIDSLDCDGTHPPVKNANPAILWASRQLRAEAGAIYYNKQDLFLDCEYDDPLLQIQSWVENVVGDLAIYLRELRVHVASLRTALGEDVQHQQTIHLKFSSTRGLTADGFEGGHDYNGGDYDYVYIKEMEHLAAHAAAIEEARVAVPGRQAEAIIDFFLLDLDLFRNACFGLPIKRVQFFDVDVGFDVTREVDCHPQDPDILVTRQRLW
jgi:hypothetical protein